jgi:predicted DNA-binding protein YlxM (UPF0122 family)
MEEKLKVIALFDIYGEVLTPLAKTYFEEYYFNNLTFQEIGEIYDVSRNAVFKSIKDTNDKLEDLENKLKINYKNDKLRKLAKKHNIVKEMEEII